MHGESRFGNDLVVRADVVRRSRGGEHAQTRFLRFAPSRNTMTTPPMAMQTNA